MTTATVTPIGAFSLPAAAAFLRGFDPIAHADDHDGRVVRLPMIVEDTWLPAAAEIVDRHDGRLDITVCGPGAGDVAIAQVRNVLSIDVDPGPFDAICAADPVLADVRQRHRLLRPVLFASVYESLAWALLSQRTRMTAAAAARARIADALGSTVGLGDHRLTVFPEPDRLSQLAPMTGVPEVKAARLRGLAHAAVDDDLTATSLRDDPDAIDRLQRLDGVGPFSAELALIRGAGALDRLPRHEHRLAATVRDRYRVPDATDDDIAVIAAAWRPYRAWAAFLLRVDATSDTSRPA